MKWIAAAFIGWPAGRLLFTRARSFTDRLCLRERKKAFGRRSRRSSKMAVTPRPELEAVAIAGFNAPGAAALLLCEISDSLFAA
jgi:hypothetical protein